MFGRAGKPVSSRLMRVLHDEISSGRWPVGTPIPVESALVVGLSVGRTTLREAVSTLAHLGMVAPTRGAGTFVRTNSAIPAAMADFTTGYDLSDLRRTRRALLVEAARLAAQSRSEEDIEELRRALLASQGVACESGANQFHATLFRVARNPLLTDLHDGLVTRIGRAALSQAAQASSVEGIAECHQAILDAIVASDPERAAAAASGLGTS